MFLYITKGSQQRSCGQVGGGVARPMLPVYFSKCWQVVKQDAGAVVYRDWQGQGRLHLCGTNAQTCMLYFTTAVAVPGNQRVTTVSIFIDTVDYGISDAIGKLNVGVGKNLHYCSCPPIARQTLKIHVVKPLYMPGKTTPRYFAGTRSYFKQMFVINSLSQYGHAYNLPI